MSDAWLWGWDATPGIVSLVANGDGHATIWRRLAGTLQRETARFRPWIVTDHVDDATRARADVTVRELAGEGELRYLVRADRLATIHQRRDTAIVLSPEEQYLVVTGRAYFHDLVFDDLVRVQMDLETTGLDPQHDRIFLVALRDPRGEVELIEAPTLDDTGERAVIERLIAAIGAIDPDVIENHNLHGFDLPFLEKRAAILGVPLALGRTGPPGLGRRAARRGVATGQGDDERRVRFTIAGRELVDTLDLVLRHDFATRDLPGHGLKVVAQHLGLARAEREHIPGHRVFETYQRDPARVRRYAADDVHEVAALAHLLGGAAFALARMVPRRYERLTDAGPATGVIDPLLVRAYLHAGAALPAHRPGDGTEHNGAALHLFAAGVARRVVKADVASLYPSLMREYRIGPARDRLGALLAMVDRLVEQRLAAKAAARAEPAGSRARHAHEAVSAAMKLVVNSAYGYLGAGGLTRFSDIHAANEVTRRGRELLDLLCRELAARGTTLLEADTDGVYFAVPAAWTVDDERRAVAEVAALLPAKIQLELEGRYAAMLSHEPKNYALAGYDGALVLRGVAFRSSRAEPFGEAFLRRALACLFADDVPGLQRAYLDTVAALRRRAVPTLDVASRVRLAKTPAEYLATRDQRRELVYEAILARSPTWSVGERILIYRTQCGIGAVADPDADPRDYDIDHYTHVLRDNFATRFARALAPDIYAAVFADPDQLSLFAPDLAAARPILTRIADLADR